MIFRLFELALETYYARKLAAVRKVAPRDGMEAHRQDFLLTDNPFRQHTAEHSIWRDDWLFSAGRFQ